MSELEPRHRADPDRVSGAGVPGLAKVVAVSGFRVGAWAAMTGINASRRAVDVVLHPEHATEFAEDLRAGGHTVHTPDLFDGERPATVDDGLALVQKIGDEVVGERADRAVADLPEGLEPPRVQKLDVGSSPIMSIALSGEMPARDLTKLADDVVKERIQRLRGVGNVDLVGGDAAAVVLHASEVQLALGVPGDGGLREVHVEHHLPRVVRGLD